MRTITFENGNSIEIQNAVNYTVFYKNESGLIKIESGCYHNYDNDLYIGKDDENRNSHGPKFYFDGVEISKSEKKKTVINILTDAEYWMRNKLTFQDIKDKLFENSSTIADKANAIQIIDRLADIITVLNALGAEYDFSYDGNLITIRVEPKLSYNGKVFTFHIKTMKFSVSDNFVTV